MEEQLARRCPDQGGGKRFRCDDGFRSGTESAKEIRYSALRPSVSRENGIHRSSPRRGDVRKGGSSYNRPMRVIPVLLSGRVCTSSHGKPVDLHESEFLVEQRIKVLTVETIMEQVQLPEEQSFSLCIG